MHISTKTDSCTAKHYESKSFILRYGLISETVFKGEDHDCAMKSEPYKRGSINTELRRIEQVMWVDSSAVELYYVFSYRVPISSKQVVSSVYGYLGERL